MGITFDDVLLIPQRTTLASRSEVDLTTQLTPKITLKMPIISANMDTVTESAMAIEMARAGGIGIIHRFLTIEREVEEVKKVKKAGFLVGAAVGIKDDHIERTEALIKSKVDVIVIDIAHGHSKHLVKVLRQLKKMFKKTEFIAGNVATAEGTEELIKNGADAIKVGIGPGALCTTRIVAGAGVPQLTAVEDAVTVAKKYAIPVISDGGVRYSSDIVKALAAGASTVMFGTIFAGCKESPAVTFFKNGEKYKLTRGMASLRANLDRQANRNSDGKNGVRRDIAEYAAEGVEAIVRYKGSVSDILQQLLGGVRSGFSYCGARTVEELWQNAQFIQITSNALVESHPHNVDVI